MDDKSMDDKSRYILHSESIETIEKRSDFCQSHICCALVLSASGGGIVNRKDTNSGKSEKKDGTEDKDGNHREKRSFVCPVCGRLLHKKN